MRPTLPHRAAFTLIEMMMVLVIMALTASLAVASISHVEAAARADRAARECLAALRYARALAMSTGQTHGLQVDTTANTFSVYRLEPGPVCSIVAQPLAAGGTYAIDLNTQRELRGATMVPTPAGTLVRFPYNALGTCTTAGSILFSYGGHTRTVTIPAVGEPSLN